MPLAVVGRCVFRDTDVLANFIDVGGDVGYLQEAASDVYTARKWIFGFGFCFATVSYERPRDALARTIIGRTDRYIYPDNF